MNGQLLDYIKRNISQGTSEIELRAALLNAGYSEEVINQHLQHAYHHSEQLPIEPKYVLIFTVVLIVIGLGIFMVFNSGFLDSIDTGRYLESQPVQARLIQEYDPRDAQTYEQALLTGDLDLCRLIVHDPLKENCINRIDPPDVVVEETACTEDCDDLELYRQGLSNRNSTLCSWVDDVALGQRCVFKVIV